MLYRLSLVSQESASQILISSSVFGFLPVLPGMRPTIAVVWLVMLGLVSTRTSRLETFCLVLQPRG